MSGHSIHLTGKCQSLDVISNTATVPLSCRTFLQMDQRHNLSNAFLFSNLHGWKNELNFKLYWERRVDGVGGTIKRSVWRNVCTTTASPNDAIACYELAKSLNMGITITYM